MALVLNEEQALLQQTAREFIEEKSPVSELRRLRDSKDPDGIDRALWTEMAELGWAGVTLPEDLGGMELGWLELGVLFEECGRTLTAHPLLSTVALAGECIRRGGSDMQRKEQLAPVAAGERLLALALQEGPHHDPLRVATRAEPGGDGHVLRGSKTQVLDGHIADALLVVARSAGESGERDGLSLFLVDPGARGVRITRTTMIDGRNAANVELDGVEVAADALVGEAGRGALKHRAAEMFVELELSRAIVLDALSALDAGRNGAAELVSCAKARCNDTIFRIGNEAVQMHGGIGVTDEEDIGLYLKRARVAQFTLGNSAFHRDRFARLEGY
jgi:alkylation response protein AidB-like acyl-CoA dehydrogenase